VRPDELTDGLPDDRDDADDARARKRQRGTNRLEIGFAVVVAVGLFAAGEAVAWKLGQRSVPAADAVADHPAAPADGAGDRGNQREPGPVPKNVKQSGRRVDRGSEPDADSGDATTPALGRKMTVRGRVTKLTVDASDGFDFLLGKVEKGNPVALVNRGPGSGSEPPPAPARRRAPRG
jgi:hypothetical protein